MKVVLVKNINNLGELGDIKEVANGFALNYLIPNKLALAATKNNIKKVGHFRVVTEKAEVKTTVSKDKLAQQLQGYTLSLSGKADETGTLFAGINKETIAKALQDQGMAVKSKQVSLSEPIKQAGKYQVGLNLVSGMKVMVGVLVKQDK